MPHDHHVLSRTARFCFLASLVTVLTSCERWRDPVELPKTDDIVEMRVSLEGFNRMISESEDPEILRFVVPKAHWEKILNRLRPYKRGSRGKKGVVPGDIILKLQDGSEFHITLFLFFDDPFEMRLGPDGIAHTSGKAEPLYLALKTAHKASEETGR